VTLPRWLYFAVMATLFICALQSVSAPPRLALFRCPEFLLPLRSKGRESPSLTVFLSLSDVTLALRSTESECPSLGFISLS
jgi:hypothetical protein